MNKKSLVAIALLAVSAISSAQSVYPGQHQGKMKKETVAPVRVESFDLKDVRLLPSRFRDNMLRDSAWMTSIDVSRLLHSFGHLKCFNFFINCPVASLYVPIPHTSWQEICLSCHIMNGISRDSLV